MPTEMLTVNEMTIPDGMDAVGVLKELNRRGEVVIVLGDDGEPSGFYRASEGERSALMRVPPEYRWEQGAKLGDQRFRNRGDTTLRNITLDDVLPSRQPQPVKVELDAVLGPAPDVPDEPEGE